MELDDQTLENIYSWVDQHQLSRPKRNITRDFSDGVLMAEIIKCHQPKLVEIHNYTPANATKPKLENWYLLNRRVFTKMKFELSDEIIRSVVQCKPLAIERVLILLRSRLEESVQKGQLSPVVSSKGEKEAQKENMSGGANPRTNYPPLQCPEQWPQANNQKGKLQQQIPLRNDRPEADQGIYETYASSEKQLVAASPMQDSQKKKLSGANLMESNVVPRSFLEEKQKESLAKDETIAILQSKIQRLEYLNHLKDLRIEDLQKRISNR